MKSKTSSLQRKTISSKPNYQYPPYYNTHSSLIIYNNQIQSFSEVEIKNDCSFIDLTSNSLTNFEDFPSPLSHLTTLTLDNNRICSFYGINSLNSFPNLRFLSLRNNPIAQNIYFKIMCLVVFGNQLHTINGEKIIDRHRQTANKIRKTIFAELIQGKIITNLNPVQFSQIENKNQQNEIPVIFKNINQNFSELKSESDSEDEIYINLMNKNESAEFLFNIPNNVNDMSFGSCCILNDTTYTLMNARSVDIKGEELGLLVNFEVTQTFYHTESGPQKVSYFFPNDLKICIYDMIFVVGDQIIKPKLEPKAEAKETYEEAVKTGHTAVYGSNIKDGLTNFKLGNIPPNTDCKVILKIAFAANATKQNSFFIKFPLDVCTPSGSRGCLDILSSNFQFQLQCDKKIIKNVKSNVNNLNFDESTKIATIRDKILYNSYNEHSIIITFETIENIQSSVFVGETINNYDNCAVTISPNLERGRKKSTTEFIFLIDCSGSMDGDSIIKASECLDLFIRSLPVNSYFNVVRFGSGYEKLFDTSVEYNESNINKALNLAANLKADLGGTEIYKPLKNIFDQPNQFGQRQIFIMTDGEVWDASIVIKLVSSHSKENRCFSIGIGRGCDAGLVERIANSSGGKCDFVQEGDSISEKVIPQLESSLFNNYPSFEIHVEGEENDDFQISPYPLPILSNESTCLVYLRSKKNENINKFEDKNFLITLNQVDDEAVDIPVLENVKVEKIDEDKYGCSNGKNIGKCILPLFAFQLLREYENKEEISEEKKRNAIELSISSGVLCKYTAYVGISKEPIVQYDHVVANRCCCNLKNRDSFEYCYDEEKDCCCNLKNRSFKSGKKISCNLDSDSFEYCYDEEKDCCCNLDNDSFKSDSDEHDVSEKIPEPKIKHYDMMTLLKSQYFIGYWENLSEINEMLGLNVSKINGVDVIDEKIANQCVATILAIAALHVKSLDQKNLWTMIELKAIEWLKITLPNADINQLIKDTESLINN